MAKPCGALLCTWRCPKKATMAFFNRLLERFHHCRTGVSSRKPEKEAASYGTCECARALTRVRSYLGPGNHPGRPEMYPRGRPAAPFSCAPLEPAQRSGRLQLARKRPFFNKRETGTSRPCNCPVFSWLRSEPVPFFNGLLVEALGAVSRGRPPGWASKRIAVGGADEMKSW